MASSNQSGSLLQEAAKRAKATTAWDIFEQPFITTYSSSQAITSSRSEDKDALNKFLANTESEKDIINKINYKTNSISATGGAGVGYIFIDFEVISADQRSKVTFSGTIFTINFGFGTDIGSVEASGVLEGPQLFWHKDSILKALDRKVVTGDGFTFAIGNGLTMGADFRIGEYRDPTWVYLVDGFGIGWEGFRGDLKIDPKSFKVVKNTSND